MNNLTRLMKRQQNLRYKEFLESRLHFNEPYNRRQQNTEALARLEKKIRNENLQLNESTRRTISKAIAEEAKNKTVSRQLEKLKSFKQFDTIEYKGDKGYVLYDYNEFKRRFGLDRIYVRLNPYPHPRQNTFPISLDEIDNVIPLGGTHKYNNRENGMGTAYKGGKSVRKHKRTRKSKRFSPRNSTRRH